MRDLAKDRFPYPSEQSKAVRVAHGRFVRQGGAFSKKLLGESAILMIDPAAPWFVLAQFDNLDHPYWSHGWHPLARSDFDGVRVQHVTGDDDDICKACGLSYEQMIEAGTDDDCQVLNLGHK